MWRAVKYEEVNLKVYVDAVKARRELGHHFRSYNDLRPHQALDCGTPVETFHGQTVEEDEEPKQGRCPNQPVLVSYGKV